MIIASAAPARVGTLPAKIQHRGRHRSVNLIDGQKCPSVGLIEEARVDWPYLPRARDGSEGGRQRERRRAVTQSREDGPLTTALPEWRTREGGPDLVKNSLLPSLFGEDGCLLHRIFFRSFSFLLCGVPSSPQCRSRVREGIAGNC